MGLDVTHGAWSGSYRAFAAWVEETARRAGYPATPRSDSLLPAYWQDAWDDLPDLEEKLLGRWDPEPEDPLLVLLIHSDSVGVIEPEACDRVAERLEQLLATERRTSPSGVPSGWQSDTAAFVAGLRRAHRAGEELVFL